MSFHPLHVVVSLRYSRNSEQFATTFKTNVQVHHSEFLVESENLLYLLYISANVGKQLYFDQSDVFYEDSGDPYQITVKVLKEEEEPAIKSKRKNMHKK